MLNKREQPPTSPSASGSGGERLTRRQSIIQLLEQAPHTVRQLSAELEAKITEVVSDLTHVQRSLGKRLVVEPARCLGCGFLFAQRTRFTAPSRCPECRSERVADPVLRIE